VSSILVNISQDASIEHTTNHQELSTFVDEAGSSIPLDSARKYERLLQYEKKFEGKMIRDVIKNQSKKEKM